MVDQKSDAYPRPFSQAAEERTDSLIQAISTLRVEAYRAHAREHPALDRALYLLSLKLTEALANENTHVTRQVSYEFPEIPAPTPFDQFVESPEAPCLCGAHRFGPDGHCTNEGCVCCPDQSAPDPYACADCGSGSMRIHVPGCPRRSKSDPDPYLCSAGCGATSDWDHLPECANFIPIARI